MRYEHEAVRKLARILSVKPRLDILRVLADGPATLSDMCERLGLPARRIQRNLDALARASLVVVFGERFSLSDHVQLASTPHEHIFDISVSGGGITLGLKPWPNPPPINNDS